MWHAVVMAGGSGTRFWPQSRRQLPKQFLRMVGDQTLIQETCARCRPLIPAERTWVVTGASHAAETARQLPEIAAEQILIEPCGRNTAACIGLAAIRLQAVDPDAVMLVLPADHVIGPREAFQQAIARGAEIVARHPQRFVLFGAPPTYPATGFGYIERGAVSSAGAPPAYDVAAFQEKPDLATAESYVASQKHYWNCGIFLWRADAILAALARYEPELHQGLQELARALDDPAWESELARIFPTLKSISIDHAVLERAADVVVLEAPFDWDDVGSWQALPRHWPQDAHGNTIDGPFCGVETRGCIVRTPPGHLVATIGIEDCIIVTTPTATLVARKHDESALRTLIAELTRQGFDAYL